MTGGALLPALLCAALGLGLASAERNTGVLRLGVLVAGACVTALVPIPGTWSHLIFLGCWSSIIANAAIVHGPRGLKDREALALTLNAAVWTGGVIAVGHLKVELLETLPLALCAWPAAWARRRGQAIVIKVLASWLIAVGMLGATLQLMPMTPGYLPDHME